MYNYIAIIHVERMYLEYIYIFVYFERRLRSQKVMVGAIRIPWIIEAESVRGNMAIVSILLKIDDLFSCTKRTMK